MSFNKLKAEKAFLNAQIERSSLNKKLDEEQSKLRSLRDHMNKLDQTDSSYLILITEILKQ